MGVLLLDVGVGGVVENPDQRRRNEVGRRALLAGQLPRLDVLRLFRVEADGLVVHAVLEDRRATLGAAARDERAPHLPEAGLLLRVPVRRLGRTDENARHAGPGLPHLRPLLRRLAGLQQQLAQRLDRRRPDRQIVRRVTVDVDDLIDREVPAARRLVVLGPDPVPAIRADQRRRHRQDPQLTVQLQLDPEPVVVQGHVRHDPLDEPVLRHTRHRLRQQPRQRMIRQPLPVGVAHPAERMDAQLGDVPCQEADDRAHLRLCAPDRLVLPRRRRQRHRRIAGRHPGSRHRQLAG